METFLRSYEQPAHRDSPTRSPARSHDQEDRAEDGSRRLFYGDLSEAARSHPGAGRDARGSAVCPLLQRRSRGVRYRGRDPVHGLVHAHGRRDTRDQASRRARCEDAAHRSVPHAVRGVPAVGEVAHRGGASPCRGPLGVVSRRRDEDTREAPAYRGVLAARALNYRSSITIGRAFLAQLERRFPARQPWYLPSRSSRARSSSFVPARTTRAAPVTVRVPTRTRTRGVFLRLRTQSARSPPPESM